MAEQTASSVTESQREKSAPADSGAHLFAVDGAFSNYPGAVFLAGHNGIVLGHNQHAERLVQLLQGGRLDNLRQAVRAALDGKVGQINPLVVAGDDADGTGERAYDVSVLPWAQGAAALALARDISLERSLRGALIDSRQRFKDLLDLAADFAWETDREGRFTYLSSDSVLGRPSSELLGSPALDLGIESGTRPANTFANREGAKEIPFWVALPDGKELCLAVSSSPIFDEMGDWIGSRGLCRDISNLERDSHDHAELRLRERLLAYLLDLMRREVEPLRMITAAMEALVPAVACDGAVLLRPGEQGDLVLQGQAGTPMPATLLDVLSAGIGGNGAQETAEDQNGSALAVVRQRGEGLPGLMAIWRRPGRAQWDEADDFFLGALAEEAALVLERLQRESELEQLSATDALTGLLNRRGFMQAVDRRLTQPAGQKRGGAFYYIDLDGFKGINDELGHQSGDRLLSNVGRVLRQLVRSDDLAGRLGGDEFTLFLDSISPSAAEQKGLLLLKSAARMLPEDFAANVDFGLSIGIAVVEPESGETLESLIERADRAMYEAKRGGKGRQVIAPAFSAGGGW